ncbi:chemotaxis response regulator protein-glutamate methylesterase [Neobacillus mesonae]|uniref:protein-glutamate methylesterase/protein-glutamine glutaminase n=1 Tax=Neobacillus mesonae TaxID=1193713 RepID=UPI00203E750E|nr:chemotaxis response regulator protein-glutamate methylesterase [Neobacillus mesonae]MCM3566981.1 chemotaxis response regulator protein-glutamate methylesterase [Neobacillus mesonae]
MKQYHILVVDDSAFMRRGISQLLEKDPSFHVVGIARNGSEAIEKVERLKPDLVTMDVEMPEMNGLEALKQIMRLCPVPIVMLSSHTGDGAKETIQALEHGAVDFFLKEKLLKNPADEKLVHEFQQRLKGILREKPPKAAPKRQIKVEKKVQRKQHPIELIFIGSSTGGPSALQTILPCFPTDFPIPIVVAQHMPPGFTKPLAERFDTLCQLTVREAQNGQELTAGNIYIFPSGYQTRFKKTEDGSNVFIVDDYLNEQALYKPSIDISLTSAAPIYSNRLLSIILTGMGNDGTRGCGLVKKHHGTVLVEGEKSCIVYGMPKAVVEAGYADGQYELDEIFPQIMSFV